MATHLGESMPEEIKTFLIITGIILGALIVLYLLVYFFLERTTRYYKHYETNIKVFCGALIAKLYMDDILVAKSVSYFPGINKHALFHRQNNDEILINISTGVFRPKITCTINGQAIPPVNSSQKTQGL